jgi:arylformamidase
LLFDITFHTIAIIQKNNTGKNMKKTLTFILALALPLLLANSALAQSPSFLDGLKQKFTGEKTKIKPTFSDVSYGLDPFQKLDVYLPQQPMQNMPILLSIHGGGWNKGDTDKKEALQNKVPHYNSKGMIVISLNYRLFPDVNPVTQAYDIGKAIAFIQKNAYNWSGDGSKIVLMGHLEGAHLVTLLTSNRNKYAPDAQPWLSTIALDGAGVDIEKSMLDKKAGKLINPIYGETFGKSAIIWKESSPMAQLKNSTAPLLMVCSSSRQDNPCGEIQPFITKAKSLGLNAILYPINSTDFDINTNVGLNNNLTQTIDKFIKTNGVNF